MSPLIVAAVVGALLRFAFAHQSPEPTALISPETEEHNLTDEQFSAPIGRLAKPFQNSARPKDLLPALNVSMALPPIPAESTQSKTSTGRRNPFSPVTQAIFKPQSLSQRGAGQKSDQDQSEQDQTAESASPASTQPPLLPMTPVTGVVPALPPVPTVEWSSAPPPPAAIPVMTPSQPQSPAPQQRAPLHPVQTIELSGVVQVGDRVGIIARESDASVSRHAFAGDYLLGGKVLIKSIDTSTQEPLVIFEYQGQEFPRVVGSGGAVRAS
ncbi:MAG: hypothetical protein AAGH78_01610 [Cyanobacteria bacterium P01_H01_bin.58]